MSIDFKIQNQCDHLINWERATLQSDKRSIYVTYNIASVSSVRLKINTIDIPSEEYDVVTKESLNVVESYFYIRMKKRIKPYRPIIEVSYTVESKYCPKCNSVKILDDIVYTRDGDFRTVENEALLIQNVEKYIITKISSNIFHKWIGTELHSFVGRKITDPEFIQSQIREQINAAIQKLKNVQKKALGSKFPLTNGELFNNLISIEITNTDDPTMILTTTTFTARSGRSLEYNQFLELSLARERVANV